MPLENDTDTQFRDVDDNDQLQAVVLQSAIQGDATARSQLPSLLDVLEEPYRTVAVRLRRALADGGYVDHLTLPTVLAGANLVRRQVNGQIETLTPQQVTNLICQTEFRPEQVVAYLALLQTRRQEKLKQEFQNRAAKLAEIHGDNPLQFLDRTKNLVAEALHVGLLGGQESPCELLELIPYVQQLIDRQQNREYLGLDSGFSHLNNLINGLDTGLNILAAPPARGKTTFAFQVACQAAIANQVPVIFVSFEQSKSELRAKALSRLSGLEYRHILRGRLSASDPSHVEKLLQAANNYANIGRHLTIVEGDDGTTLPSIQQLAAATKSAARASRCFIVIDYLQIVPLDAEQSQRFPNAKDRVDYLVSALRRVARDLDSPIWAISSLNRSGYTKKSLDVFKESGAIEYSADTAMLLSKDDRSSAENVDYVPLRLNIIKNRNGERGVVTFKFYPKRAEFVQGQKEDLQEDAET
jgi:replicative DNA helicase